MLILRLQNRTLSPLSSHPTTILYYHLPLLAQLPALNLDYFGPGEESQFSPDTDVKELTIGCMS